jgi:hypothetical protein
MPKGIPRNKEIDELEKSMGAPTVTIAEENVPGAQAIATDIPGAQVEKPVDPEYKIEVIKDFYGNVDIFYLPKKDHRYEYRFLRADDKNLSLTTGNMLFQGGGWQLCGREHCERIGIDNKYISPDGFHRRGDLILAFIPKHLYQEKRAFEDKKAKDQLDAIENRMKNGSPEGSEIHETMKGLQTQEQLGIK